MLLWIEEAVDVPFRIKIQGLPSKGCRQSCGSVPRLSRSRCRLTRLLCQAARTGVGTLA